MTAALHGVLAATELEDTNLVAAAVRKHGGLDGGAFNHGLARLDGAVFSGNEKNVVQGHFGAGFGFEGFNLDGVANGNAILLAAGTDDCVHEKLT